MRVLRIPRYARPAALVGVLFWVSTAAAFAGEASLIGRFREGPSPVPAVRVRLVSLRDTTDVHVVTARDDGSFEVRDLAAGAYRLEATRLAYERLDTLVRVTQPRQDLGALALTPSPIGVAGLEVKKAYPVAVQRGDTTEFQADAVKTHKDADAEELVNKLPGVSVENGQLKAHGEAVQQVLVNGRPFFGNDPMVALRNVPADVIERIQVYDRQSDQSELSGFDDGQRQRTMNLLLRDRAMRFGKASAGLGDQQRYRAAGNASWVRGTSRLTAIGLSNDVNERNFSPQDLLGVLPSAGGGPRMMMAPPGGGGGGGGGGGRAAGGPSSPAGGPSVDPTNFLIGQQSGVSTTHSGGINGVTSAGSALTITSSLFANRTDNDNDQTVGRRYLPPEDLLASYRQRTVTDSRDDNQRIDARIEWTPDSIHAATFQPRLYFQRNRNGSRGTAANYGENGAVSRRAESNGLTTTQGDNLSARLTARRRFAKRGRNLSADFLLGGTRRDGDRSSYSITDSEGTDVSTDTLDQRSDTHVRTGSYSSRIAFTESVNRTLQVQAIYAPSLAVGTSDARGWRADAAGAYTVPDSATSNQFENRTMAQSAGAAVQLAFASWKLLGVASFQRTTLHSKQTFPVTTGVDRSYEAVLPSLTLSGTLPDRSTLRAAWSTSVTLPSIGQLQNVVDDSNPLALSVGNPGLQPADVQTLSFRWTRIDPARSRSRFVFVNATRTAHPIGKSTFTAARDTTVEGVRLAPGTQLTRTENLGESWTANGFGMTSRPVPWLRSVVSTDGGVTFTRAPSRRSGVDDITDTWALRGGLAVASNVSTDLDFTLSYQGSYHWSRGSASTTNSADYYTHTLVLRLNAVLGPGIVVREELSNGLQSGVPAEYGGSVVLWNTTIGKKLLRSERGEIRVTATDVLGQNRSVSRSLTETYVQDSRDRTLQRYVMAALSFSFR